MGFSTDIQSRIPNVLIMYLSFLIAVVIHQAGIAIFAKKRGDHSPTTLQMATLNPKPHMEIFGTVIFPLLTMFMGSPFIFGWPRRFDISSRYFKKPRRDTNIVYLAGPLFNILVSIICAIIIRFSGINIIQILINSDLSNISNIIFSLIFNIGVINIVFMALYLLPFKGSAGWHLLINNVSYNMGVKIQKQGMIIDLVLLALIIFQLLNFFFKFFQNVFMLMAFT